MKKTAQDFGSHRNRPASRVRTEESAETTCESEDDYLGFRLVHDDSNQVLRGGSWCNTADVARAADRGRGDPGFRVVNLGFRLCADWSEE